MVIIGVDCHTRVHVAAAIDGQGQVGLDTQRVPSLKSSRRSRDGRASEELAWSPLRALGALVSLSLGA